MTRQLDEERERRSKAEMAASRLVDHVRSLQAQLGESARDRELAVARVAKLDGQLKTEKERVVAREEEVCQAQEVLTATHSELEAVRARAGEQESALRTLGEEEKRREASHVAEKTELVSPIPIPHFPVLACAL